MTDDKLINTRLQNMTREQLIHELRHAHSEEFVLMFLGFLVADTPELQGQFELPRLPASWEKFKREMGK
jgi:hypothetical protein